MPLSSAIIPSEIVLQHRAIDGCLFTKSPWLSSEMVTKVPFTCSISNFHEAFLSQYYSLCRKKVLKTAEYVCSALNQVTIYLFQF